MLTALPPRAYEPVLAEPEWVPRTLKLPSLETDPFGWTREELEDASRAARRWLGIPRNTQEEGARTT